MSLVVNAAGCVTSMPPGCSKGMIVLDAGAEHSVSPESLCNQGMVVFAKQWTAWNTESRVRNGIHTARNWGLGVYTTHINTTATSPQQPRTCNGALFS